MLKNKKVVVIDDEQMITELVGDVLRKLDAFVEATNDSQKAIKLIQTCEPSLIVLDRNMPEPDGLEILKAIKNDYAFKDTPVIMLTGANRRSEIREAVEAGADGYVIKPFKPMDLIKQIKTIINKKKETWYVT